MHGHVEAMWRILQQNKPDDFVIATGQQISVRQFVELCALELGWGGISWSGKGVDEVGMRNDTGQIVVRIDPIYFRPAEVSSLLGNASRAKQILGWEPRTTVNELVSEMISSDLNLYS